MGARLDDLRRLCARYVRGHARLHAALHPPYIGLRRGLRRIELARHGARLDAAGGNARIRDCLLAGTPAGVAKIGSLEAEAMTAFLGGTGYSPLLLDQLHTNVGLFPPTAASVDRFCDAYAAALGGIDLLAVWGQPGEAAILRRAPAPPRPRTLMHIDSLEPWYHAAPWSAALAGRRVVVLHPFAATIARQYRRRREIWGDDGVLPDFHLRTVRMPLSPALAPPRHRDWEARFRALMDEVEAAPHDVLLVGAGGISLIAAARARAAGRVGIHMGGLTQILFGVLGRRWEGSAFLSGRRNAAWTRPSGEEAPETAVRVEQGCYW